MGQVYTSLAMTMLAAAAGGYVNMFTQSWLGSSGMVAFAGTLGIHLSVDHRPHPIPPRPTRHGHLDMKRACLLFLACYMHLPVCRNSATGHSSPTGN